MKSHNLEQRPEEGPAGNREEWLKRELKKEMAAFDGSAPRNRLYAQRYMFWGAVSSTVTTILLGWQGVSGSFMPYLRNTALVCSAGVTILSAFNAFYNHREIWVRYTVAWAQIRSIEKDLAFLVAGDTSDKERRLNELYERFRAVLDEADSSWLEIRKSGPAKPA
jgi:hypothetical protein